ncbi:MAG: 3-dehydroquinate synthase [Oscillospiraceae bacterium]|nr:3-dehydroquinate synthase [Oscillospiraceae bacterium]
MDKLHVNLGADSYDICFTDSFDKLTESLEEINAPKKLLIVTDTNVEPLYAKEVNTRLVEAGYDSAVYAFKAGEENKSMDSILGICGACVEHGLDRKSMILALGGGVVGDMAGFAAAIYMRGIDFIQIPTTLLSQSDSSVGGKTGIDFMESKNILGAFHQPKLVYINVNTLKTLPPVEFVSGMGEVVKHGIIRDAEFYRFIKENSALIKSLDSETLIKMSKINCGIKANVVEQDEKENGLRAILNFGHTIGHAAESSLNFTVTHGECVGLGMMAVSKIAVSRGLIDEATLKDIEETLREYDFRVRMPLPPADEIYGFMQKDKKKANGKLKFVLPVKIGDVMQTRDVTEKEIYDAIEFISE